MAPGLPETVLRTAFTVPPDATRARELALGTVARAVWSRKLLVLTLLVLGWIAAAAALGLIRPSYTATATLRLNARAAEPTEFKPVVTERLADAPTVESEMDVIRSASLAVQVVEDLQLLGDPEFDRFAQGPTLLDRLRAKVGDSLLRHGFGEAALPAFLEPRPLSAPDTETRRRTIAQVLLDRLEVSNNGRSYTIRVGFSAAEPERAAAVANGFVEAYLRLQAELRREITAEVGGWLGQQLAKARERQAAAHEAVETFRGQNDVFGTGSDAPSLAQEQLREVNRQLAEVQAERAALEAKAQQSREQMAAGEGASLPEVVQSPLIQKLREAQGVLTRRRAELAIDLGSKHPSMQGLDAEARDIERKIQAETESIVATAESALRTAVEREQRLRARLERLHAELRRYERGAREMRELEREAAASDAQMAALATRHAEVLALADARGLDTRVVALASPPTAPSAPQPIVIFGLATVFSGLLAGLLAWQLERPGAGFRSADEVEREIQLPCLGIVPCFAAGSRLRRWLRGSKRVLAHAHDEAMQRIGTAVHVLDPRTLPRVVLVTSSVPDEGKSTLVVGLANHFAEGGMRSLIIDGDIRNPSVARLLERGQAPDDDGLTVCSEHLHVLDLARQSLPALAGSHRRQLAAATIDEVMRAATAEYHVVIIDAPPVVLLADALLFARYADTILYVVHWDRTPREAIAAGLSRLYNAGARVTGLILSRVDLTRHARYGIRDEGYYASVRAQRSAS